MNALVTGFSHSLAARTLVLGSLLTCCLASTARAGDLNNDGFDDLVVGVPGETVGNTRGGAVAVIYGTSNGLSATAVPDQLFHQNSANVPGTVETGDGFGTAVVAGDFNGDGRDDLAVGVPNEDISQSGSNVLDAGFVTVIFGAANGLSTSTILPQAIEPTTARRNAFFGRALAADDFDDDGFVDLAIGAPGDRAGGLSNVGTVHVLYGSPSGLDLASRQIWSQASTGIAGSPEFFDGFGSALAAGDFAGSGVLHRPTRQPSGAEDRLCAEARGPDPRA